MYRICLEKETGKIVEIQSGGYIPPKGIPEKEYRENNLQTLVKNAKNVGYKESDIIVRFITPEEYKTIFDQIEEKNNSSIEKLLDDKINLKIREMAMLEVYKTASDSEKAILDKKLNNIRAKK